MKRLLCTFFGHKKWYVQANSDGLRMCYCIRCDERLGWVQILDDGTIEQEWLL